MLADILSEPVARSTQLGRHLRRPVLPPGLVLHALWLCLQDVGPQRAQRASNRAADAQVPVHGAQAVVHQAWAQRKGGFGPKERDESGEGKVATLLSRCCKNPRMRTTYEKP